MFAGMTYGTFILFGLLILMGGGFISAVILFAIICAAGTFFLRSA